MILIRMTYFSRIRLDRWSTGNEMTSIAEILETSIANNRRDGITGALICDDRWFAQALEGAERVTADIRAHPARSAPLAMCRWSPCSRNANAAIPVFAMVGVFRSEDNGDLFRHYGEG